VFLSNRMRSYVFLSNRTVFSSIVLAIQQSSTEEETARSGKEETARSFPLPASRISSLACLPVGGKVRDLIQQVGAKEVLGESQRPMRFGIILRLWLLLHRQG